MRDVLGLLAVVSLAISAGCGSVIIDESELDWLNPSPKVELEVEEETTVAPPAQATAAAPDAPARKDNKDKKGGDWSMSEYASFVKGVPANPRGEGDGLEKSREWTVLDWANPAEVAAWKRREQGDDVILVTRLKGGKKDKVAVARAVNIALDTTGALGMDVYNGTDRKIDVAFAVHATVDDVYSESTTQPARPGWTHLEWDLSKSNFKTEASGWKNEVGIWGAQDIRRLVVLFYDSKEAAVAVDRIEASLVEKE